MYRSTPSCHATSVVARSSRIAPLGAIRPPQAAAGSACVRNTARVAAAAGTSLLNIGTSCSVVDVSTQTPTVRKSSNSPPPPCGGGSGRSLVRGGPRSLERVDWFHDLAFARRAFRPNLPPARRPPYEEPIVVRNAQRGFDFFHAARR